MTTPALPLDIPLAEWTQDGYVLSTDPARLDRALVHRFLSEDSYWAKGIERDYLDRAIDRSLALGLYAPDGQQAGFARVVTDYTTMAYLRDVFVLPAHRGRGLATWLAQAVQTHPGLAEVKTWMLVTGDAQNVYARAGFVPVQGETFMRARR